MIDSEKIKTIKKSLKRTFVMPVGRSTFREIQNIILTTTNNNVEEATAILEALLTGQVKESKDAGLKSLLDEYSVQVSIARDVFERGEFVNNVFSEIIGVPEQLFFVNRFRRIDGEEFNFLTDVDSTLHLISHFVTRLKEIEKTPSFEQTFKRSLPQLQKLKETVNDLIKT